MAVSPTARLYTITLWVGNCFSDQGGAFSPQGWEGRAEGNQSNFAWRGGPTMAAKVAITSVTIVTADGTLPPTLTPVLHGDNSRRRDCHFYDTPCSSLLKRLIKFQGGAIK